MVENESQRTNNILNILCDFKVTIILCNGSITEENQSLIKNRGIMAIERIENDDLNRICMLAGLAQIYDILYLWSFYLFIFCILLSNYIYYFYFYFFIQKGIHNRIIFLLFDQFSHLSELFIESTKERCVGTVKKMQEVVHSGKSYVHFEVGEKREQTKTKYTARRFLILHSPTEGLCKQYRDMILKALRVLKTWSEPLHINQGNFGLFSFLLLLLF